MQHRVDQRSRQHAGALPLAHHSLRLERSEDLQQALEVVRVGVVGDALVVDALHQGVLHGLVMMLRRARQEDLAVPLLTLPQRSVLAHPGLLNSVVTET